MLILIRTFRTSCIQRQSSISPTNQLLAFISNVKSSLSKKNEGGNDLAREIDKQIDTIAKSTTDTSAVKTAAYTEAVASDGPTVHYKRSTHPTSVPLNKLFSNSFPYSITDSVNDYSFRANPLAFQHDLLALLPFYPHTDSLGRTGKVFKVFLDEEGSGNFINEFAIYPPGKSEHDDPATMKHLIMIHGYGGGLGFWLKNYDEISRLNKSQNWCIHAIDLLGYGCSSRPPFELENDTLDEVEDWFHVSYQKWLQKRGLDKVSKDNILIMAHSMGAYLMATYGIRKDPSFCKKIIMVSPGAVIKHRTQVHVPTYFSKLWERNISPFVLVRKAGPLGSKLVSLWSTRRFANLPEEESKRLHKYAYGIFQSPGSGEYMLNYLLAPGADARHPLIDRGMDKLKCDFLWCYGKEDWMDVHGGELCSDIIRKQGYKSEVLEIPDSGHHIYLDNIEKFNELIVDEMNNSDQQA